jgi:hypothetical protein
MEIIDIIGYLGVISFGISFFAVEKRKRFGFILLSLILILICVSIKIIIPLIIICLILGAYIIKEIKVSQKAKNSIKLVEVTKDNIYLNEFLKNYKKDIYSFFPFYIPHSSHKHFLIMRDMNLAGILICNITKKTLTIELDYIKPIYRDNVIGYYIYNKNTGMFKSMGIERIIGKSFHKSYSKYLKRMGFLKNYIDDQLFYVKNID